MRIIKEGTIPNVEYIFNCDYCGCEFAVTEVELISNNPFSDKNSYTCPTCHKMVYGPEKQVVESSEPVIETDSTGDNNE